MSETKHERHDRLEADRERRELLRHPDPDGGHVPGYRHGSDEALEIAERGLIFRCLIGSGVHGIKVGATDDRDEMGMCIEPPDHVVGLRQVWVPGLREHIDFEQYVYRTQPEGHRSGPGDLDYTCYSLRKWMRLALQGNPTMLLPLFVHDQDIMATSTPGRELRDMASGVILSRHAGERFMGYLCQQRGRLVGELGGKDCNRPELVEAYGFDTKYAAHMVRLGVQGLELIETGRITLPVPEPWRSWLIELRLGRHSQDEALTEAKRLEDAIGNLLPYSPLPPEPDRQAADEWLIRTYQETWKAWAGVKGDGRKPYDPRLIPERQVLAGKLAILDTSRSTDSITRAGEQYICTCRCGAAEVTSDETVVSRFRAEHEHAVG